jgi:hypothetical protein
MTTLDYLKEVGINYTGSVIYSYRDGAERLESSVFIRNPLLGIDMEILPTEGDSHQYIIYVSDDGLHCDPNQFNRIGEGIDKWNELIDKHKNLNKLINKL